nr:adenosylcobinamide amidohydrolase [Lysinibacillus timonensis]
MITPEQFINHGDYIVMKSDAPLRTFSSAAHNPGYGEFRNFVNRTVDLNYNPINVQKEMEAFLEEHHLNVEDTVAMMTAVNMQFAHIDLYEDGETSVTIFVTAGLGNTVDVTRSHEYAYRPSVGTINIFIFINGRATDEALIQALICAVEVKAKVMQERQILDQTSNTIATGTSTDSILVAATQMGEFHQYGGSITRLGSLIGKGLYATLDKAVVEYLQYKEGER